MKKNDLSHSDISERQQKALSQMLSSSKSGGGVVNQTSLEEARFGKTLYEVKTTRDQTRVLFISRDEGLLGGGAHSIDGYLNLGEVFDEVHIVLLRTGTGPVRFPVLRVSAKVWLYIATAKDWWRAPFTALTVIDENLAFAGGFRADIIIAHDPFESALVASMVSDRYQRPYQIHIQHDFYHPRFLLSDDHPYLRRWLGKYLLRRASSVRTASDQISQMVHGRFPMIPDVETLPRFNKYEASLADPIVHDVKRLYPEFSLTVLYIGSLNHNNLVHQIIDGIRPVCENSKIGLIIAGAGPAKAELEKRVKRLKLERHVVFETAVTKQIDYLKTADVLIVSDTTSASDELVIQGAVFHTALVAVPTTIRTDLFEHNSSILFFEPGKSAMITAHLRELINDKALCTHMADAARAVVGERLYNSPSSYRHKYRESVEKVLFLDDEPEKPKKENS
jgi:glycosyltransferase involved in cell wall biosynthesis